MKAQLLIIAAYFCTQVFASKPNPKLKQCKDKILDQIAQVKLDQYQNCFDIAVLKRVKNQADIIEELYKTLSPNCKRPISRDISGCLKQFKKFMNSRSTEVQAKISEAVHGLFEASRGCVKSLMGKVDNLDRWVLNGCED